VQLNAAYQPLGAAENAELWLYRIIHMVYLAEVRLNSYYRSGAGLLDV
jgi:hypothetical protein